MNMDKLYKSLSRFLAAYDEIIQEFKPGFDEMVKRAQEEPAETIGTPDVGFDGSQFVMLIPNNLVAFCGNPLRLEAVVSYYAMRSYVQHNCWSEEATLDQACDTLFYALAVHDSRETWWQKMLRRLHITQYQAPKSVRYYSRFQQGKRVVEEYESLL